MSARKQLIRKNFNEACMKRDKYECRVCGSKSAGSLTVPLEVHHITNRNDMPNGGYVKENGITLCGLCHFAAEHNTVPASLLYKFIGSSYDQALDASRRMV